MAVGGGVISSAIFSAAVLTNEGDEGRCCIVCGRHVWLVP